MLDDHWWKSVAAVGDFSHRASLSAASLPSYPVILTKPQEAFGIYDTVRHDTIPRTA
jgi:hypothetical protein